MTKELFLQSKPRYDILDGLRGVAALVILLYHVLEGCGVVLGHGYLGVDFFYVLSGFVIGYAYDERWGRMSAGGFFKRRIIRLQVSGRPVLPAIHHPPASGEPANRVCIQPSRSSPVEPHHGIGSHVFPFGCRGLRLPQTVRRARAALVAAEVDAASRHLFIRT